MDEVKHKPTCNRSGLGDDDWNDATAQNYRNAYGQDVPCTCAMLSEAEVRAYYEACAAALRTGGLPLAIDWDDLDEEMRDGVRVSIETILLRAEKLKERKNG